MNTESKPATPDHSGTAYKLDRDELPRLLAALRNQGYELVGPTIEGQAIVYDAIDDVSDLPEGWTDEQEAGSYRLKRRDDAALFGYNVGPYA